MNNAITTINQNQKFSLTPRTLEEAMQYAKLIADSDFAPKDFRGKPGNVLIAVQCGADLGLSPTQAIQNISVINGRPCVWGDAMLAIVRSHPMCLNIHEEIENGIATCTVERRNNEPVVRTFSIDDAKKAGLWGKAGPWTQYPNRMLQMRARGFALRDSFADALKGIQMREEVLDYNVVKQKTHPVVKIVDAVNEIPVIEDQTNVIDINSDLQEIESCKTMEELEEVFKESYKYWVKERNKEAIAKIIKAKDDKKQLLQEKLVKEFNEEIDQGEKQDE